MVRAGNSLRLLALVVFENESCSCLLNQLQAISPHTPVARASPMLPAFCLSAFAFSVRRLLSFRSWLGFDHDYFSESGKSAVGGSKSRRGRILGLWCLARHRLSERLSRTAASTPRVVRRSPLSLGLGTKASHVGKRGTQRLRSNSVPLSGDSARGSTR